MRPPKDLSQAILSLGTPTLWREVTRLQDHTKACFCVEMREGLILKVRRLISEERAETVLHILQSVELEGFPAPLLRQGSVLVEPWIEGREVELSKESLTASAQLLSKLHGIARVGTETWREIRPTESVMTRAKDQLNFIVELGFLSERDRNRTWDYLLQADPGETMWGLVHRDFCGENLIYGDQLYCIDNEWLDRGPLLLDLARVFSRWSLSTSERETFLSAYGAGLEPTAYWELLALLQSLSVRAGRDRAAANALSQQLRGNLNDWY